MAERGDPHRASLPGIVGHGPTRLVDPGPGRQHIWAMYHAIWEFLQKTCNRAGRKQP
jgi:hypothetical protein